MPDLVPARPAGPCEDQLKECEDQLKKKDAEIAGLREKLAAKDAEIAQLKKQVAELTAKPGLHPPPAGPFLPHHQDGPWGKG